MGIKVDSSKEKKEIIHKLTRPRVKNKLYPICSKIGVANSAFGHVHWKQRNSSESIQPVGSIQKPILGLLMTTHAVIQMLITVF